MKAAVVLLFLTPALLARVDENKDALVKRFGEPTERDFRWEKMKFRKGGYVITCDRSNKAYPKDTYELETGEQLSERQIELLLKQMADFREVVEYDEADKGQKRWTLGRLGSDKRIEYVTLSLDGKRITVTLFEWAYDAPQKKSPTAVGF